MPTLTPALLASIERNAKESRSLVLTGRQISHIEDISFCTDLNKLDLSHNSLGSREALSGLQYCKSLTWLNLSHNQLDSLNFIFNLPKLNVLNISNNRLTYLPSSLSKLTSLKALIANNNQISVLDPPTLPSQLNTLILSHNHLEHITLTKHLRGLEKLSLSHNKIHSIEHLEDLHNLRELRLNNNSLVSLPSLPPFVETLDVGNNPIKSLPIGPRMRILNIKDTMVDEKSIPLHRLEVLNGRKLEGKRRGSNKRPS